MSRNYRTASNPELNEKFHLKGVYTCPVCHHGEIAQMPLMEAFSCSFCHHIFTPNFEQQVLKMADSQLPLTWYWNGKIWKGIQRDGMELSWGYLIAAIVFVLLPTSIIGFSSYLFPPLPGSWLAWLPIVWVVLTFFAHLGLILWLVVEYYQLPIGLYINSLRGRLRTS